MLCKEGVDIGVQLRRVAALIETWSSEEDVEAILRRAGETMDHLMEHGASVGVGLFAHEALGKQRPEPPDQLHNGVDEGRGEGPEAAGLP